MARGPRPPGAARRRGEREAADIPRDERELGLVERVQPHVGEPLDVAGAVAHDDLARDAGLGRRAVAGSRGGAGARARRCGRRRAGGRGRRRGGRVAAAVAGRVGQPVDQRGEDGIEGRDLIAPRDEGQPRGPVEARPVGGREEGRCGGEGHGPVRRHRHAGGVERATERDGRERRGALQRPGEGGGSRGRAGDPPAGGRSREGALEPVEGGGAAVTPSPPRGAPASPPRGAPSVTPSPPRGARAPPRARPPGPRGT